MKKKVCWHYVVCNNTAEGRERPCSAGWGYCLIGRLIKRLPRAIRRTSISASLGAHAQKEVAGPLQRYLAPTTLSRLMLVNGTPTWKRRYPVLISMDTTQTDKVICLFEQKTTQHHAKHLKEVLKNLQ